MKSCKIKCLILIPVIMTLVFCVNSQTINRFTPMSGCAGTTLTIAGSNLSGTKAVTIGGVAVSSYNVINDTTIIAVTSDGNSGLITAITDYGIATSQNSFEEGSVTSYAYISNSGSNNVSVINTVTNTVVATLSVGSGPHGVCVRQDGKSVYVANSSSNNVSVINTATNTIVATVSVGNTPNQVCISPDGESVYVTNLGSNTVSVINTATNTVVATVSVGIGPYGICVSPNGKSVYVENINSNNVSVINTVTNSVVATVSVGNSPHGVCVSPDGKNVYVANTSSNNVSVINTATNSVDLTLSVGSSPLSISVNPDGKRLYISNASGDLTVIDAITNNIINKMSLSKGYLSGLNVSLDGSKAYVVDLANANLYVVNLVTKSVVATVKVGSSPFSPGVFITNIIKSCNSKPAITSFFPISAGSGEMITIKGTNLSGLMGVSLGGTPTKSYTVVNDSTVTTVVSSSGSTGKIGLATDGGSVYSDEIFNYIPTPIISSLSPTNGCSGTIVTIKGMHLSNTISVSIGNINVESFTVVNDSTITVITSNGSNGQISVNTTGGLAISRNFFNDGSGIVYAYSSNYGNNTVNVINTATNDITATVSVGKEPAGIVITPDGSKVYVANYGSNSVSVINTSSNAVLKTVSVGLNPIGISVSPDSKWVYVANSGSNTVSVVNTTTNTVAATVNVGAYPIGVCVSTDGKLVYVVNYNSNKVSVINSATNTLKATISVGNNPHSVCISPDGKRIYVTNWGSNTVSIINSETNVIVATITVGSYPVEVIVSPDNKFVYVVNSYSNTVSVLNTITNTVVATVLVGNNPYGVTVSHDNKWVYVTNNNSDFLNIINTDNNTVSESVTIGNSHSSIALGYLTPCDISVGVISEKLNVTKIITSRSIIRVVFDGNAFIEIFNLSGVLIKQLKSSNSCNISNLSSGYYLVKINGIGYKAFVE